MKQDMKIKDLVAALDTITGGRVIRSVDSLTGKNPFVVTKSSNIPGKAITETLGLWWEILKSRSKKWR